MLQGLMAAKHTNEIPLQIPNNSSDRTLLLKVGDQSPVTRRKPWFRGKSWAIEYDPMSEIRSHLDPNVWETTLRDSETESRIQEFRSIVRLKTTCVFNETVRYVFQLSHSIERLTRRLSRVFLVLFQFLLKQFIRDNGRKFNLRNRWTWPASTFKRLDFLLDAAMKAQFRFRADAEINNKVINFGLRMILNELYNL